MPSLVENLERAAELNERLEELIREGHSVIKTMRITEREFKQGLHDVIDEYSGEQLAPKIEEFAEKVQEMLNHAVEHVMGEWDKFAKPMMQSLDLLREAKEVTDRELEGKKVPFVLPGL